MCIISTLSGVLCIYSTYIFLYSLRFIRILHVLKVIYSGINFVYRFINFVKLKI